ncbi:MAG: hypothetical protein JJV93_00850 [Alphaproteobacteria bacterium]|nr:hypothetical protein [Alphaproteobacteria bacterium]MBL0717800.1 hypothetical protein [Alphaproteobacteria bacterium]
MTNKFKPVMIHLGIFLVLLVFAIDLPASSGQALGEITGRIAGVLTTIRILIFIAAGLLFFKIGYNLIKNNLTGKAEDGKAPISMEQIFWIMIGFLLLFLSSYVVEIFVPQEGASGASGYLRMLDGV